MTEVIKLIRSNALVGLTCATICIVSDLSGQSARLVGTLRDVNGALLNGKIDIIAEGRDLTVDTHLIGADGEFLIHVTTEHGIVVHASTNGHPPEEHYIPPLTQGTVPIDFVFPMGRTLVGRVIDQDEVGVENATVHVRYHEPTRPLRRAAFHEFQVTDGDGYYSVSKRRYWRSILCRCTRNRAPSCVFR